MASNDDFLVFVGTTSYLLTEKTKWLDKSATIFSKRGHAMKSLSDYLDFYQLKYSLLKALLSFLTLPHISLITTLVCIVKIGFPNQNGVISKSSNGITVIGIGKDSPEKLWTGYDFHHKKYMKNKQYLLSCIVYVPT